MTEICANCTYWNNDTGFCLIEMILKSKSETCEYWEGDVE